MTRGGRPASSPYDFGREKHGEGSWVPPTPSTSAAAAAASQSAQPYVPSVLTRPRIGAPRPRLIPRKDGIGEG
jgi:hypothetical protein